MLSLLLLLALQEPAPSPDDVIVPPDGQAPRTLQQPDGDDEETLRPHKGHRRADPDDEEEDDRPRRRGRKPMDPKLAGLASGAAACGALPLMQLVVQFVPLVNFIPCLGPVAAGMGAGVVAWAVAGLLGKRRVPMGTLMLAAAATQLGVIIPGTILTAALAVGILAVGLLLAVVVGSYGAFIFFLGGYYGALGVIFLCGGITTLLAWTTTATVLGILVGVLGRPLERDEDALNLDGFTVPGPEEGEEEDLY